MFSTILTAITQTRGRRAPDTSDWLSYLYLTVGTVLMFGPVLWLVLSSFKTQAALLEFPAAAAAAEPS